MDAWKLEKKALKNYPHFDAPLSASAAQTYVTLPHNVATHSFFPFIRYIQRWNRFAEKGQRGEPKERPIRYGARVDAYIFSYYRHQLSERYEAELARLKISNCVLAYRRIPTEEGEGGKCNIHFAKDAFSKIEELGNCYAICLDISSYFESLDHMRLKSLWCRLLGVNRLPEDHHAVFKAITNYSYVEKQSVYERLGYFGPKRSTKNGKSIDGYLIPHKEMPKQLCSPKDFRLKIAGEGAQKAIIKKNKKTYGVPQGAPLSDLLANFYLMDFDVEVNKWMVRRKGAYFRYSDDILLIGPGGEKQAKALLKKVQKLIGQYGSHLKIKDKKSSVYVYSKGGAAQSYRHVLGEKGGNGLEYLGFRFDGKKVFLRDSTLTNLNRKVVYAARRQANKLAGAFVNKDADELWEKFSFERFVQRFGRVEDFEELQNDVRSWTFWTYASRAAKIFGVRGAPITRQLRSFKAFSKAKARDEVGKAVERRDEKSSH